jgi:polyphosphate glucokinase
MAGDQAVSEETAEMASSRIAIGVDVGGSGIKAAVVDVEAGRFRSERHRVPTPTPSTPEAVLASINRLVKRLAKETGTGDSTPVGIGLPGVTIDGVLKTAANIDPAWLDFPVVERMARMTPRPVTIINDADAAGMAEMRFGVGRDQPGVVIFLTLGTGVGSGVFVDGKLVPNTEFGQMEIRGRAAERRSAAAARVRRGLSWKAWAIDLDEHLDRIYQLMWPNLMIIGGGVSKNADKYIPRLTIKVPVVPAQLRNDAGIIGAAIVAAEANPVAASVAETIPIAAAGETASNGTGAVPEETAEPA